MDEGSCYFHPEEVFVGVCPLCLYERLILLAEKPKRGRLNLNKKQRPLLIILPKMFAFGNSLLTRRRKSQNYHTNASSPPQDQDDSFISIKFENNGVGAWDKGKVSSKVSMENCNMSWKHSMSSKESSVVEHAKPQASLRWRKRIGQLFQVVRWRRSNKVNTKLEGVKVKVGNGWITSLTNRRSTNS